jgi:hypothetical protein
MIISTILSLLFVPNLYIVIKSFEDNILKGENTPRKPDNNDKDGGNPETLQPSTMMSDN